jgi:hypothetical protein
MSLPNLVYLVNIVPGIVQGNQVFELRLMLAASLHRYMYPCYLILVQVD